MSASQNDFTAARPAEFATLLVWYVRKMTGRCLSLDDIEEICKLAVCLPDLVHTWLPCVDEKRPGDATIALALNCWWVQYCAYEIEELLNPWRAPFGSEQRKRSFRISGSDKVHRAATQFLTSIDKLAIHYGWHTDTSRAEWEKNTNYDSYWMRFNGACDAVQEPQPAPVDVKLPLALKKSANALWEAVLNDLPQRLGPEPQKAYAKAMQPDTRIRVLTVLFAHPDWSDEEIAKAAGVSRGHMYRIGFKELRANLKAMARAEAKERARRGVKYTDKQTGDRVFYGIEEGDSLGDDDESTGE
jgi:hypothetical protein